MSYTKAVLDYKLATQHEDKIKNSGKSLSRVKVYKPSPDLCKRIEAVETDDNKGECAKAVEAIDKLIFDLKLVGGLQVDVKEINNRYKLAGNYCVKVEYHFPEEEIKIKFPVDPDLLKAHAADDDGDEHFVFHYHTVLDAYNSSKAYVEKLRARVTVLRDD